VERWVFPDWILESKSVCEGIREVCRRGRESGWVWIADKIRSMMATLVSIAVEEGAERKITT